MNSVSVRQYPGLAWTVKSVLNLHCDAEEALVAVGVKETLLVEDSDKQVVRVDVAPDGCRG